MINDSAFKEKENRWVPLCRMFLFDIVSLLSEHCLEIFTYNQGIWRNLLIYDLLSNDSDFLYSENKPSESDGE